LGRSAYAVTFPLLTTASGAKMGKTAAGAVWLSAEKTSPFDFYQYWINTDDRDVYRFLKLYTYLPLEEIEAVRSLEGQDLNSCKTILAYEVTRLTHGPEEALGALKAASQVFGARRLAPDLLPSSSIPREGAEGDSGVPTTVVSIDRLSRGIPAFELFAEMGLCESKSAARRLIQQGGAYVNEERVEAFDARIGVDLLASGVLLLKAGKKKVHRVRVEE